MSKDAAHQRDHRPGAAPGAVADHELLRRHAEGDPQAFAELVSRHRDRLWAVALRTLGDPEEAADALQDALLSAFRAAGRFRGDTAVTTWLHRIVVNACLDRVRRRAARPATPLGDAAAFDSVAPVMPDPTDAHVQSLDIHAALGRLPFEQRAAVVLVDMMGYSVDDAAQVLAVPPGTVKSRCARGRTRLSGMLRIGPASAPPEGADLARLRAALRRLMSDPGERERITAIAAEAVADELPRLPGGPGPMP
ncbi:RNA polymerase sigma factor SigM [Actinomadura chibensis]|uniref:RNA polymerase sigma factor SigM n=1 Tax=Actinomadura chibensis TaxID=392828 RepID=A0A5D0NIH5_9ACTN|nr:RNA polymerase sigma factor SigM [Actinomadura chibensis]TYB44217.1 RNA polymerase sigma factor SigM [Actinomadura chibensis]